MKLIATKWVIANALSVIWMKMMVLVLMIAFTLVKTLATTSAVVNAQNAIMAADTVKKMTQTLIAIFAILPGCLTKTILKQSQLTQLP